MITPQTNTDLPAIAQVLRAHDSFVICGHVNPDGDCLGSQLVVAHALRALGKRVTCVLAQDAPIDSRLAFMPGADGFVAACSLEGPVEVFLAVDVPTVERMGDAAALQDAAALSITIDHHAVPTTMATLNYVDPDAASTTLLAWELASCLGVERDAAMATCAYTGLVTDTGRFQFQNADARAFAAAAEMVAAGADPAFVSRWVYQNRSRGSLLLEGVAISRLRLNRTGSVALSWVAREDFERFGAVKADAEPLIDTLRSLEGVRVACILREQDDIVRGSLRAKDDTDVSALARKFDGGGHRAAAGFTVNGSLDFALAQVCDLLEQVFPEDGRLA